MRTKVTILLLVLNAALFAYIFHFEERIFGPDDPRDHSSKVLGAEASDLDYLRIEGRSIGSSHVLERQRDRWRLSSPVNWPANQHAVSRILNHLEFLEAETAFSTAELQRTGLDLADYGLDDPGIVLTLGRDDMRREIRLGSATDSGNRLYLHDPARERIHVVRRELAGVLATPLDDLRSNTIFEIPLFEVRSLTLELASHRNLKMRVVRSDNQWHFETPIQVRADRAAVEAAVNNLAAIRVRRFEGEISGDLAPYGLDRPSLRITIDGNMRSQSLQVGNEVTSDSGRREYYAKIPSGRRTPTIFTIAAADVDPLREAQEQLRDRDFLRFDPDDLSAISIGASGREPVSLQRLETGSWQLVTRQPDESIRLLRADDSIVNRLVDRLEGLRARSFESDAPSASDKENFGLTEPQRRVTLSGDRERTLLLGYFSPTRANEIYAKLEGSDFIYTVDSSILDVLPVISRYYRDRLLMSRPEGARITSVVLYSLDRDTEIFNVSLPSRNAKWDDVLAEEDEAVRQAVLDLLPELRQLRVENYILNEFSPVLDTGRDSRSWNYVLEATYALTGGEEDQTSYFELYLTDRMGGQTMMAGSPELNVVFSARPEFIEAVGRLIDEKESDARPLAAPPIQRETPDAGENNSEENRS